MHLHTLSSMAEHFLHLSRTAPAKMHVGLDEVATHIEHEAKDMLGHYQPGVGKYGPWAPLAEETIERRMRAGFTPEDPLLASHQLQEAITHETQGDEAVVGVKSGSHVAPNGDIQDVADIMVAHEFGTGAVPPRPVLGPAAFKSKPFIEKRLGQVALSCVTDNVLRGPV